ncbi:hypothetical protein OZX65_01640 [Leuconostocaceae bacterium ESL0723]|nr:hypothetical protein OZX65_01640 [Leuconostocaceae bacterium ESL0723]
MSIIFWLVVALAVAVLLAMVYRQQNQGKRLAWYNYLLYVLLVLSYVLTAGTQSSGNFAISTIMVLLVMALAWYLQSTGRK